MDLKGLTYEVADGLTLRRGVRSHQAYGPIRFHPAVARFYPRNYQPEKVTFLQAHAERGSTAIDVGAHIGLFTVGLARWVGPTGHVHSFEASAGTCEELRRTIRLNGATNVTVHHAAVCDRNGTIDLHEAADRVSNANSVAAIDRGARSVAVPAVRLDDVVHGPVSVIKIDAEGAETDVLRGAAGLIERYRPAIALEVHPANLRLLGSSAHEVLGLLEGYALDVPQHEFVARREDFEVQAS
jgi:FkbM family methyltransferase